MQPQQPSKKTVKAKAKVVAKKPTAQSVAAQRTAMIKKMKGDTAKPAAKKVMPKMAKGSGCVPKMADGTGKVKAPSTAAKRASTATASKVKITEKPSIDTRLNRVSNDLNKQYKRLENIRTVDRRSDASTKLQDYNDASRSIMRLEIEKPLAIEEKRKRNATLEKAVSGKMKSGSGCVSKYPDGSGKIKPTSTAARRASTATEMPKKRKPMTDEEEIRAVRGPKMNVNIYNYDTQREIRGVYEAQDKAREIKKLQQRQRDRKLEKAVSGKMKSGTKKVKC